MKTVSEALLAIEKKYFEKYIGKDAILEEISKSIVPKHLKEIEDAYLSCFFISELENSVAFLMVDIFEMQQEYGTTEIKNYLGLIGRAARISILAGIEHLKNEKGAKAVELLSRAIRTLKLMQNKAF